MARAAARPRPAVCGISASVTKHRGSTDRAFLRARTTRTRRVFGNLYKKGGGGIAGTSAGHAGLLASLIDRPLLTPAEVLWVDDYHATVWDRVSPLLAEGCEGRRWLREATRPLEGEAALAGGGSGEEAVAV